MSRRNAGEAAAAAASEAARVMQARQQEVKQEAKEPPLELKKEQDLTPRVYKRGNPDREAVIESIRESRGQKPEPEEPKPEVKEEPKAEPVAEVPPVQVVEPPVEAPKTVRAKVDGEEFDAPADDVEAAGGIKAYQIMRAADNRLKKATDVLAEARRIQAEAPKPAPKPKETSEFDGKTDIELIEVERFGTPEDSLKAKRELNRRLSPQPVDQNSIVAQTQAAIDHQAAVRQFDKEHADLVRNPVILQAIVGRRATLLQQHQQQSPGVPIDWSNFYSTIAHDVRGAFGRQSQPAKLPATSGTPSQSPSEKEARKSSITNLPTAAARAELPKEEKPESREESLNRMRKTRGQPAL